MEWGAVAARGGADLSRFQPRHLHAVDLDVEMIQKAGARLSSSATQTVSLYVGDITLYSNLKVKHRMSYLALVCCIISQIGVQLFLKLQGFLKKRRHLLS